MPRGYSNNDPIARAAREIVAQYGINNQVSTTGLSKAVKKALGKEPKTVIIPNSAASTTKRARTTPTTRRTATTGGNKVTQARGNKPAKSGAVPNLNSAINKNALSPEQLARIRRFDNYLHMAENATTQSARDFWASKYNEEAALAGLPPLEQGVNLAIDPSKTSWPDQSSAVGPRTLAMGYDPTTQTVYTRFRDSTPWHYENVPPDVWARFSTFWSPGRMLRSELDGYKHGYGDLNGNAF